MTGPITYAAPHDHAQWLVNGTRGVEMADCPAMQAVRAYLEEQEFHWILILASETAGSGKSLAMEWLRTRVTELVQEGHPGAIAAKERDWGTSSLWCDCNGLDGLAALTPWDRAAQIERLKQAWLVTFDDLGTEPPDVDLTRVLRYRQGRRLLTFATTNLVEPYKLRDENGVELGLNPKYGRRSRDWLERYDGRVDSRLRAQGDVERNSLSAWCHVPSMDMRGRLEPKLRATPEPKSIDEDWLDRIAAPLLQRTAPKEIDRRAVEQAEEERAARVSSADALRRKTWGAVALDELGKAALAGDESAAAVLDRVKARCT